MAMLKHPFVFISILLLLLGLHAFPIEGSMRLPAWIDINDQRPITPGHSPGVGHSINNKAAGTVKSSQRRRQLIGDPETADEDCLCTADKMLSKIEDDVNRRLKERGLKVKEWKE